MCTAHHLDKRYLLDCKLPFLTFHCPKMSSSLQSVSFTAQTETAGNIVTDGL